MWSPLSTILLDRVPDRLEDPRLLVGLLSAVVMLFGARLYRLVLVAPGFACGVLFGLHVTASGAPKTQLIAALCLGVLGGGALLLAERLAVAVLGAVVVAGICRAVLPLVLGAAIPWYVPAAAGLVGLLLVPRLLRAGIKLLTPLLGAIGVAWAVGRPGSLPLIGGLAVFGALFQLFALRGDREQED